MKKTSVCFVYPLSFCFVSKEIDFKRMTSHLESRYILCASNKRKFASKHLLSHGWSELKVEIRQHVYYFYGNSTVVSVLAAGQGNLLLFGNTVQGGQSV